MKKYCSPLKFVTWSSSTNSILATPILNLPRKEIAPIINLIT